MNIIAYSYEADHHCIECTYKRFGGTPYSALEVERAVDNEGNPVHPLFDTNEWHEPSISGVQTLSCGDCGRIIDQTWVDGE